mmetsp:Transcript_4582/g.8351  ORF Transcript_4582/g.8351 Transcript_4582/m.8351 type:complete len:102 (-) Transcript_4582:31-336(-)
MRQQRTTKHTNHRKNLSRKNSKRPHEKGITKRMEKKNNTYATYILPRRRHTSNTRKLDISTSTNTKQLQSQQDQSNRKNPKLRTPLAKPNLPNLKKWKLKI